MARSSKSVTTAGRGRRPMRETARRLPAVPVRQGAWIDCTAGLVDRRRRHGEPCRTHPSNGGCGTPACRRNPVSRVVACAARGRRSARRETDLAEFRFGQHAHDRRHRVRYGGACQFELQARLPGLVVDDRGVDVKRGAEHLMQQAPHMRQIAGADAYRHQHARVRPLRSHANRRRSVANARVRCMQGRCGDRLGMETQRLHMRIFRAAMRPGPRRFRLEHDGHSRKRREDSVYRVPRSTKNRVNRVACMARAACRAAGRAAAQPAVEGATRAC